MSSGAPRTASMRRSMSRRLGRLFAVMAGASASTKPEGDLEADFASEFRGVPVQCLVDVLERLLQHELAPNARLFEVTVDQSEEMPAGTVLELVRRPSGGEPGALCTGHRVGPDWTSVAFDLSQTREKRREDWSVAEVQHFVDLVKELEDAQAVRGEPFQGAYVVHSHASSFSGLVKALEHHAPSGFVWMDSLVRSDLGGVSDARALAISAFDGRLVFVDSWADPQALGRAWCLWEMYSALSLGRPLKPLYAPDASQRLANMLRVKTDGLLARLKDSVVVSMRSADCGSDADLEVIHGSCKHPSLGFWGVNNMITAQLRLFIVDSIEQAVENQAELVAAPQFALLFSHAGIVAFDMGRPKLALEFLHKALAALQSTVEEGDIRFAVIHNAIGLAHQDLEEYEKALRAHELAFNLQHTELGSLAPEIGQSLLGMGTAHLAAGRPGAALEMHKQQLTVARSLPTRPPLARGQTQTSAAATAQALECVGRVLHVQGELGKALNYFEQVHQIRTNDPDLDDAHPLVARAKLNVAEVLADRVLADMGPPDATDRDKRELDDARNLAQDAFDTLAATMGNEHIETAQAKALLDRLE